MCISYKTLDTEPVLLCHGHKCTKLQNTKHMTFLYFVMVVHIIKYDLHVYMRTHLILFAAHFLYLYAQLTAAAKYILRRFIHHFSQLCHASLILHFIFQYWNTS